MPTQYTGTRPFIEGGNAAGFNFQDSPEVAIDLKDSMALQANKLAEHEGKISGLTSIVTSLQSYKGFLQAAIIAVGSLLLVGIVLVYTVGSSNASRIERDVTNMSGRMATLEVKVDALPDRVSASIREVSRDLVLISQGTKPPAASNPPTSATPATPSQRE
jgi:hypothetical protein